MVGYDSPDGCRYTNRPQFGWILLVLVQTEEVCIGEVGGYAWRYLSIVDPSEKQANAFVNFGTVPIDQPDKHIQRVHEKAICSALILPTN